MWHKNVYDIFAKHHGLSKVQPTFSSSISRSVIGGYNVRVWITFLHQYQWCSHMTQRSILFHLGWHFTSSRLSSAWLWTACVYGIWYYNQQVTPSGALLIACLDISVRIAARKWEAKSLNGKSNAAGLTWTVQSPVCVPWWGSGGNYGQTPVWPANPPTLSVALPSNVIAFALHAFFLIIPTAHVIAEGMDRTPSLARLHTKRSTYSQSPLTAIQSNLQLGWPPSLK